ncbi:hypothetical protein ACFQLX_14975 [Streptomyces polyrhachis]|uniref:Uncharacterized protein n=1 Tax=Streptomyces polyrhachis TaxID=1282885 RepID=A0ABW2GK89_9ACTN
MAVEAGARREELVAGRVWTVRLDPDGRPAAGAVRVSCSRPVCADQRFTEGAVAGRRAAIGHVNTHLGRIRAGGGPRDGAGCACRGAECSWHLSEDDVARGRVARCGGPVVLAVCTDRAGRWWRIAEMCARCAAATSDCRVLDSAGAGSAGAGSAAGGNTRADSAAGGNTRADSAAAGSAVPAPRSAPGAGAQVSRGGAGSAAAVFSDAGSPTPPTAAAPSGGASPPAAPRRVKRQRETLGTVARLRIPYDLRPDALRRELLDLGDAFRAYQKLPEPDLTLLAGLHERKARAFQQWAAVSDDAYLRQEARRADAAARATLAMRDNRRGVEVGTTADGEPLVVEHVLSPTQAGQARATLDHVRRHAPPGDACVRLTALLLALRAARSGTAHLTGQDLSGWLGEEAGRVLEDLVASGWLEMSGAGSTADVLASRPESPTPFALPDLLPDGPAPLVLGKLARTRISGWAQKAANDRKLRKKKAPAGARLLALYCAAHARLDGRLGADPGEGLGLEGVAAVCAVPVEEVAGQAELLVAGGWLAEAEVAGGRLRGRLGERVLALSGRVDVPVPVPVPVPVSAGGEGAAAGGG